LSGNPIVDGYPLDELLSALQKEIRRGHEYEAMHWAVRIERFNCTALWNRLTVIASEDVGLGSPIMPIIIHTLRQQYEYSIEKKNDSYRLFLTNAVLQLCRSRKSRIVDDLLCVVYYEIEFEDKRLEIPHYAIDNHTVRGMQMGHDKALDVWFNEGTTLSNEAPIPNGYSEKAEKMIRKYGKLPKKETETEKKEQSNKKEDVKKKEKAEKRENEKNKEKTEKEEDEPPTTLLDFVGSENES